MLLRTKDWLKKLPPVDKAGNYLPSISAVCVAVNIFNYLVCCLFVYATVLTGIVIESLSEY